MELNNIRQLYDYNRWADRRVLRATWLPKSFQNCPFVN
jgi:hypothetical protein